MGGPTRPSMTHHTTRARLTIIGLLTLCVALLPSICTAQLQRGHVHVEVTGLDHNAKLRNAIERNTGKLLEAMNTAQEQGWRRGASRAINYAGIDITEDAKRKLDRLYAYRWIHLVPADGNVSFVTEKAVLNRDREYEVRNIKVLFRDSLNTMDVEQQEIGITFNRNTGRITHVAVTMGRQQFGKILDDMERLVDESHRYDVIDMMEALAEAYCTKDIDWFRQFLSDDVLVVTGSRKITKNGARFTYSSYDKAGYLSKLQGIFKNAWLNVKFTDMEVYGHPLDDKGRYYAVQCKQYWACSNGYRDVGNLFVIWDFSRRNEPQILFRGWTDQDDPKQWDITDFGLNFD